MLNSTNLLRSHQARHDPLTFRIMCLSATASAERPHALARRSQVQAPTLEGLPPEEVSAPTLEGLPPEEVSDPRPLGANGMVTRWGQVEMPSKRLAAAEAAAALPGPIYYQRLRGILEYKNEYQNDKRAAGGISVFPAAALHCSGQWFGRPVLHHPSHRSGRRG